MNLDLTIWIKYECRAMADHALGVVSTVPMGFTLPHSLVHFAC